MNKWIRGIMFGVQKSSPIILAGLAVTGVFGTGIFATKAGMKAKPIIDRMREEGATTKEIIKAVAPLFGPAAAMAVVTSGCIIGSTAINEKRNAVLASLCSTSELALTEYQKKTLETVGEKTEKVIRDGIVEQQIAEHPVADERVISTGHGSTLFYDMRHARYFTSDIEFLRQMQNELNANIIARIWITVQEFYWKIGLEPGEDDGAVGWNVDHMLELEFTPTWAGENRSCLAMSFKEKPKAGWLK